MKRFFLIFVCAFLGLFAFAQLTSAAFEFNGTVYDLTGQPVNNSLVNITVVDVSTFNVVGYNYTYTNESGWFNLSVANNTNWMYTPTITKTNDTWGYVQLIGQSLPSFPSEMLTSIAGTSFFLREAGTVNITALNSTGDRITFTYQIKDTKLGYAISESFQNPTSEAVVSVPKDRNYSIMIFPSMSMPVSFNWNNFSASQSYTIDGLSSYNFTTKTLHKQFNTTMDFVRTYGYILNETGGAVFDGWDSFTIVPYMIEPGGMVHVDYGDMPYNLSAFFDPSNGDEHNLASGYYNISLPSTVETSEMLLFAVARNGSSFYGGVRNVSFSYGTAGANFEFNFTMYELLGGENNITMETVTGGSVNISSAKTQFDLINSTNGSLTNVFAHAETTVDYSGIGAREFTWMSDIQQGGSSSLLVPLLNVSVGVKEMNVFVSGGNYAPKRVSYTQGDLQEPQINITITSFEPQDIGGSGGGELSGLKIALFKSNSTCDVPSPNETCVIGGNEAGEDFGDFDPMGAVMGGGALSFRMGLFSSGIIIHYVNVDLLASGPPDALFDDSENSGTTSGSFESAFRFGSQGPTIYDYVLISMPYTQGSSSTTGLNETGEVNMSIPLFYDDDWNIIWNVTANGTNASDLASNYSHYSDKQDEWQTLMNPTTCTTNSSLMNTTTPCYIDQGENRIWIRLPHFSGTGPQVAGNVITEDPAEDDDDSGGSSSGGGSGSGVTTSDWTNTFVQDSEGFDIVKKYEKTLKAKQRVRIKLGGEKHYVGVKSISGGTSVVVVVESTPQEATILEGESKKFDATDDGFYDLLVRVKSVGSNDADIEVTYIHEAIPETSTGSDGNTEGEEGVGTDEAGSERVDAESAEGKTSGSLALWISGIVVALAAIAILIWITIVYYKRNSGFSFKKNKNPGSRMSFW